MGQIPDGRPECLPGTCGQRRPTQRLTHAPYIPSAGLPFYLHLPRCCSRAVSEEKRTNGYCSRENALWNAVVLLFLFSVARLCSCVVCRALPRVPTTVSAPSLLDGDVLAIKEHLIDELDYILIPTEGWNKLLSWYGLKDNQEPISRKVRAASLTVRVWPGVTAVRLSRRETRVMFEVRFESPGLSCQEFWISCQYIYSTYIMYITYSSKCVCEQVCG